MPMVFAGIVLSASTVEARVVLPHVLSDGMVLQQQTDVRLRGKAIPGCKVEVTGSWDGAKAVSEVANDSLWCVTVSTPKAGGPYEIVISDGDGVPAVIRDVLIGEVWFCAGQSNMEMPMRGI